MESILFLKYRRIAVLLICLVTCPVMGQGKLKRMLQREDYARWQVMTSEGFSNDGRWCSYSVRYESGLDTLFVKRTDGKKQHAFPKGTFGKFNGNGRFACGNDRMQLRVLELETGKASTLENILRYEWVADGRYLLFCQK